jgi:hypothetical protein
MRLAILLPALLLAGAATAGAPPPIRSFDIPILEKLAHDMYAQDQEAWKATDVLLAAHSESELHAGKIHGWIVETVGENDIVRFIHDGESGPEFAYDVTFTGQGAPTLSTPSNRALSAGEQAQYDARMLALKNAGKLCSDVLNTVALKDPERGGWLVWAMSATRTDPNVMILGGHTRFTISADGKNILQKDALTHDCVNLPKADPSKGTPAGVMITQVVSLVPVETLLFATLTYREPLLVGTLDGKAWKADAGRLAPIDMDMPGVDGFAARALLGLTETCFTIGETADKKYRNAPTGGVIAATEHDPTFAVPAIASGDKPVSLMCSRADIIPTPNDYKVLAAGLTLFIHDNGVGHPPRTLVLEMVNGQLRIRMLDGGDLNDPALQARLQARLNQMQTALQVASAKP